MNDTSTVRIGLSCLLVTISGLILFVPIGGTALIAALLASPLFFILIGGWYIGRVIIASIGHALHNRNNTSVNDDELPTVSVLLPAYNEEENVEATIKSIDEQDYPNDIEIVVVDDGSTDDTWTILQELAKWYSNLKVYHKENEGISPTRNFALTKATNDVIVSMDMDTAMNPQTIREGLKPFANDECVAVAGNVQIKNDDETMWTRMQAFEYPLAMEMARMFQYKLKHLLCISGAFGVFRRDVLEDIGGWNESVRYADDFDLSIKMQHEGTIVFTPDALVYTDGPTTAKGWFKQRVRWARNGLRTLFYHKQAQFNPTYGMTGLFGLPLKALFSLAVIYKIVQFIIGLFSLKSITAIAVIAKTVLTIYAITLALACYMLSVMVLFMVSDRYSRNARYFPIYLLFYRPIHIATKAIGFTIAVFSIAHKDIYPVVKDFIPSVGTTTERETPAHESQSESISAISEYHDD